MARRFLAVTALLLATLVLGGCPVATDLGKDCVLVRKDPADPKKSIAIKWSEITPGRDFVSFSVVECEDLTCVRDGTKPRPADAKDSDPAVGYCSRACVKGSSIGCPAANSADDKDPDKRLSCRPLILDESTLQALRVADPALYKRVFGETTSPYFCARGGNPDGGI